MEKKMTNLLSHYATHYTMHIVIENRSGKNPGKHFLCILCANTCSNPHGLLHITSLDKNVPLFEWIVFHAYPFMACLQLSVLCRSAYPVQPGGRRKAAACSRGERLGAVRADNGCRREVICTFPKHWPAQNRNKPERKGRNIVGRWRSNRVWNSRHLSLFSW